MSNDFVIKVSKTTYQHCLNFSYHLVDAINKHKKICHSIKSNCVISQFLISKYKIFHLINNFIINKLSCFNGIHEIIVVPKKKSKLEYVLYKYVTEKWVSYSPIRKIHLVQFDDAWHSFGKLNNIIFGNQPVPVSVKYVNRGCNV